MSTIIIVIVIIKELEVEHFQLFSFCTNSAPDFTPLKLSTFLKLSKFKLTFLFYVPHLSAPQFFGIHLSEALTHPEQEAFGLLVIPLN